MLTFLKNFILFCKSILLKNPLLFLGILLGNIFLSYTALCGIITEQYSGILVLRVLEVIPFISSLFTALIIAACINAQDPAPGNPRSSLWYVKFFCIVYIIQICQSIGNIIMFFLWPYIVLPAYRMFEAKSSFIDAWRTMRIYVRGNYLRSIAYFIACKAFIVFVLIMVGCTYLLHGNVFLTGVSIVTVYFILLDLLYGYMYYYVKNTYYKTAVQQSPPLVNNYEN